MAQHAGAWTHGPWLSGLRRLSGIAARVWPVARRAETATEAPTMARGERILTVAGGDAPTMIGSTRALYYRPDDQPEVWVRISWAELDQVSWQPDPGTVTLAGLPGSGRPPTVLHVGEPGWLLAVCRDRIAASIITTTPVAMPPDGALITVRRAPGTDALVWTIELGGGLDSEAPAVRRQVDTAIRAMRVDLGL